MEAWQERTSLLIGEEGIEKLKSVRVTVVGIGGVGAYAAEMLVRAGVGYVTLLDSDTISDSNRNRQLLAMTSTALRKKTDVARERLLDINPLVEIEIIDQYLDEQNVTQLIDPAKTDYLIDAIDTLSPKLNLISHCVHNNIPLVSSMGSGAKFDITKVRITDISKTYNCPLAYIVRKRLRHMGVSRGFKAVFSEELPDEKAIVPDEGRNKKSQVGTISYLPAVFGCACAQAAILFLLGKD